MHTHQSKIFIWFIWLQKSHSWNCYYFFESAINVSFHTYWTELSHWGRVTHTCVGNLTIIGPDNGLSPGRRQAIIRTNTGILLIEPLRINFSDISIEIHTFSFKEMHLKMSSGKWRPFCLGLNVLMKLTYISRNDSSWPRWLLTQIWHHGGPKATENGGFRSLYGNYSLGTLQTLLTYWRYQLRCFNMVLHLVPGRKVLKLLENSYHRLTPSRSGFCSIISRSCVSDRIVSPGLPG